MRVLKVSAIGLMLACGLEGVVAGQQSAPPPQRAPQGRAPVQGPQRPTRDPRQPPTEGTGTVSGRVVDATTGQGLARVRVRFAGRDGGRSTLTDAEGAFTFTRLPRGNVMLMVEKPGYLGTTFPERRQTMRNAVLMLADGQKIDSVSIPMTRSSAVVGRLVDPFGDAVENVMVQAVPAPGTSRRTQAFRPTFRGGQSSNDIGEFRIARLDPGQYYLLAVPQRRGDDEGTAIGRTFYPGVASIDQAQPITVEKGQTVSGLEFTMLETTLVKVMGTVVNANGEPVPRGSVSARMPPPPGMNSPFGMPMMGMPDGNSGIRENGSFEFRLQPGEYNLEAMPMSANGTGGFQSTPERGRIKITVGSEPLMNVVIQTGAGGRATGRLVFNGRKAPPTDFRGASVTFQNAPGSVDCQPMFGMAGPNRPTINPDGTFVAENLWGACVARAQSVAGWQLEAVMHRGNDVTNRPIQFQAGQQVTDLQLVFTDRVGEVSLEVADERGQPLAEYVAIVFPAEKERWGDQRFVRTHVASASMNQMQVEMAGRNMAANLGGFVTSSSMTISGSSSGGIVTTPGTSSQMGPSGPPVIRNLIAGEYFAVVVDDLSYDDLRDPEFLGQLANVATRVTVAEGDARPVQLRRVPVPEDR